MKLFGLIGDDVQQRRAVLVSLVEALAKRRVKVATLHEAPAGFDPDRPGKDSYEHRKAGAFEVLLMAPHISALMHENGERSSPGVAELAQKMSGAELVLVDGFEGETHPKARIGGKPCADRCDARVVAKLDPSDLDIEALADLVLARAAEV